MDSYIFTPKEIVLHWFIRLYSYCVSKRDRRTLYKRFVTDLHLDKLQKENVSFCLPDSYLIATDEINRLYDIRDTILTKMHDENYVNKQVFIDTRLVELAKEQSDLKSSREIERKKLARLRAKLKSMKNSEDYIALESNIDMTKSRLKNTGAAINHCKDEIIVLNNTKKQNCINWEKQKALVEKTAELMVNKYIKRATKKIELSYGFTGYTHVVRKYDEDCKKIIKGERRDEKATAIY